jgi:hypothetical protein
MKMPQNNPLSLWNALVATGDLSRSFVADAGARVPMCDLVAGSALDGRGDELRGLSVLITSFTLPTCLSSIFHLSSIPRRSMRLCRTTQLLGQSFLAFDSSCRAARRSCPGITIIAHRTRRNGFFSHPAPADRRSWSSTPCRAWRAQ